MTPALTPQQVAELRALLLEAVDVIDRAPTGPRRPKRITPPPENAPRPELVEQQRRVMRRKGIRA